MSKKIQGISKGLTSYGDEEFSKFIRRSFAKSMGYTNESLEKPIVGICRGMLLISKFFGAKLYKISGHVRTRHKCKFLTKDKLFPKSINSYHNFSIKNCPKHFYVTIKSEDSSIEAIKHKKFNWEGWMWHPEREKKFNTFSKKRIIKIFR